MLKKSNKITKTINNNKQNIKLIKFVYLILKHIHKKKN